MRWRGGCGERRRRQNCKLSAKFNGRSRRKWQVDLVTDRSAGGRRELKYSTNVRFVPMECYDLNKIQQVSAFYFLPTEYRFDLQPSSHPPSSSRFSLYSHRITNTADADGDAAPSLTSFRLRVIEFPNRICVTCRRNLSSEASENFRSVMKHLLPTSSSSSCLIHEIRKTTPR